MVNTSFTWLKAAPQCPSAISLLILPVPIPVQKKKFHVDQKKFHLGVSAAGEKNLDFLGEKGLEAIW